MSESMHCSRPSNHNSAANDMQKPSVRFIMDTRILHLESDKSFSNSKLQETTTTTTAALTRLHHMGHATVRISATILPSVIERHGVHDNDNTSSSHDPWLPPSVYSSSSSL